MASEKRLLQRRRKDIQQRNIHFMLHKIQNIEFHIYNSRYISAPECAVLVVANPKIDKELGIHVK